MIENREHISQWICPIPIEEAQAIPMPAKPLEPHLILETDSVITPFPEVIINLKDFTPIFRGGVRITAFYSFKNDLSKENETALIEANNAATEVAQPMQGFILYAQGELTTVQELSEKQRESLSEL